MNEIEKAIEYWETMYVEGAWSSRIKNYDKHICNGQDGNDISFTKKDFDKLKEELAAEIKKVCIPNSVLRKYLEGLIIDYGYCDCNSQGKDFHMSVVKDLEKMKQKLLGDDKGEGDIPK